jgi:hypothetical protein
MIRRTPYGPGDQAREQYPQQEGLPGNSPVKIKEGGAKDCQRERIVIEMLKGSMDPGRGEYTPKATEGSREYAPIIDIHSQAQFERKDGPDPQDQGQGYQDHSMGIAVMEFLGHACKVQTIGPKLQELRPGHTRETGNYSIFKL